MSSRTRSPFLIVPWDDDFMLRVHNLVDELTNGRPGKAVIVFPLNRPKRYLLDIYRKEADKPLLLPRIINAGQLAQTCLESWTRAVPRMAGTLDQVAALKECLMELSLKEKRTSPLARLADTLLDDDGMARFYPWGARLAHLLDECAGHLVEAEDLLHVDDVVAPYAAALLGSLSRIQERYRSLMRSRGMSTPGMDAQRAAQLADASPDLPLKLQGKSVVLAGFVRLTCAEDRLFRYLWERGARVCLHTDPEILSGAGHWSCAEHKEWLARWKAKGELLGESRGVEPVIRFHAGYDLHSQLLELKKELENHPHPEDSRAVVITHDSLLMPTLHHIPEKNINISLGYPLERSLLAQLVERLMETRRGMNGEGLAHWKSLMALIRHPYVRMLGVPADGEGDPSPLRPFLSRMEERLRTGSRLVDAQSCASDLVDDILGDLDGKPPAEGLNEATGQLLEKVMETLVSGWRQLETLNDMASRLRELCRLLLEYGAHIWPRFPLDAECLARLMQGVIPELSDNAMAEERLSMDSLFAIVRQELAEQRVPFEADPLTGLQILGTLETRLLHFDRVYLLDLTEDALPGAPARDPLLPDSLRPLLGLPDNSRRDMLAAHTFHRLIAGAKEVCLYWQEGVQTGVMDGKKLRSRLVEEAIWRVEQRRGETLRPGEAPLFSSAFPMTEPPTPLYEPIPRTDAINEKMDEILSRQLSPTSLDAYISCPARFFRRYVCSLKEQDEVMEGDDHLGVGTMLHAVLLRAFQPLVGQPVGPGSLNPDRLERLFREELDASGLTVNLPAQSRFMLEAAGPSRLKDFASSQPEVLKLLQLEHDVSAVLEGNGRRFTLEGTIDRLDRRERGLVVLDYKSGSTSRQPHASFWGDEFLWEAMEEWLPGRPDPMPDLARSLYSVQLPAYMYMCGHDPRNAEELRISPLYDAALVQLADRGEEIPLFGPKIDDETRERVISDRIPALLRFILRHMATASSFSPIRSERCARCPYRSFCR
ncbi:PD-(D/E)XK nuclease family protein [Mailhella sp.]|uniref:PD-(D/E)XK nuclease family protein n=1 Tax=Mailhella sp. TaxID=1981029 RepID=UPI003AB286EA